MTDPSPFGSSGGSMPPRQPPPLSGYPPPYPQYPGPYPGAYADPAGDNYGRRLRDGT